MKKFISIIVLLLLVASIISCDMNSTGTTSSSKENENQTSDTITESVDSNNNKDDLSNDSSEEINESSFVGKQVAELGEKTDKNYYQTIQAGNYLGEEFQNIQTYESRYAVLKTYEELCEKTERGSDYPLEIFDDSYVVAICAKIITQNVDTEIGYSNMRWSCGVVSIDKQSWYISGLGAELVETEEITYIIVPKSTIGNADIPKHEQEGILDTDGSLSGDLKEELVQIMPDTGAIIVHNKEIQMNDSVMVKVDKREYENGTTWILDPKELSAFLEENDLPNGLDWHRKCDCECEFYYCSTRYKILVFYWDEVPKSAAYGLKSVGYTSLNYNEGVAYISRNYAISTAPTDRTASFEFVAVNSYELPGDINEIAQITVNNLCHITPYQSKRASISNNNVTIEDKEYGYYNMLELGNYLPQGDEHSGENTYHIITSYKELLSRVENPFVKETLFLENYVVAIKIKGCQPNLINGIRDLYFENERLCATLEYSACDLDNDTYYCYIAVSRSFLDISGKELSGELDLAVNTLKEYEYFRVELEKNYLATNQVWFVNSHYTAELIDERFGGNIAVPYYERGYVLLIYYGELSKGAKLSELTVEGNDLRLSFVQKGMHGVEDPQFYVIKIEESLLNGATEGINTFISKYAQSRATRMDENETEKQSFESFYATRESIYNRLEKTPDFEYKFMDGAGEFLEVLTEYVRVLLPNIPDDIDFEGYYILAFNAVQECEECALKTSFCNARVANGNLYIDVLVDSHTHENNRFLKRALHFILIPKEIINTEINDVVFIKAS